MNYSHDNWSAILAHIGKPEELDTSARNAGALTRRREIRDAATLLRLGLAYGPGGMSLREVTAWAQLHDVATLSDVALLKRLRNAADWFGILAAQTLAVRAAVTGCTSGKRLRLVDGTAISAPGGGSAEWRLHMGYDPHTCQFTDFELTDSRAETLNGWTDLRKRQTRYALLTGDSVRVPNVSAHLLVEKLIISSGFTGEDCAG